MKDKFAKNTHCLYCEEIMEAKYRNKKFCSDKCRIYFNREKKINESLTVKAEDVFKPENFRLAVPKKSVSVIYKDIPPMPIREEGEDGFSYAERKNEWKLKYNQK